MSDEEFFAGLTGGQNDFARAVAALRGTGHAFCLIGGLAINHYIEPMVTLDADFAVAATSGIADALRAAGFLVEEFPHSLNALYPASQLRFQLTLNGRYAPFAHRATEVRLFGVPVPVAALEDLVQGKIWAASDPGRRRSKRQKDRLDLTRLAEAYPRILPLIPPGLVEEIDAMRGTPPGGTCSTSP